MKKTFISAIAVCSIIAANYTNAAQKNIELINVTLEKATHDYQLIKDYIYPTLTEDEKVTQKLNALKNGKNAIVNSLAASNEEIASAKEKKEEYDNAIKKLEWKEKNKKTEIDKTFKTMKEKFKDNVFIQAVNELQTSHFKDNIKETTILSVNQSGESGLRHKLSNAERKSDGWIIRWPESGIGKLAFTGYIAIDIKTSTKDNSIEKLVFRNPALVNHSKEIELEGKKEPKHKRHRQIKK